MTIPILGRLQSIDPRTAWEDEARDFTPWLALPENLKLLGDSLGIELELESMETSVGPFRADILCKDGATGSWVLVENQLEWTDHRHLGQLLTYAAGLETVTIVWIARQFREEHRAALDWLNQITEERFNFFGLEVELWQIGDSVPAPKFNLVSKPNDWTRSVGQAAKGREAGSEREQLRLAFWEEFVKLLKDSGSPLRPAGPRPWALLKIAIGRGAFGLWGHFDVASNRYGVGLSCLGAEAKPHFYLLRQSKDTIENEFGEPLTWDEAPDQQSSYVYLYRDDNQLEDQERWGAIQSWMKEKLEKLHRVFAQRVQLLDASEYQAPENSDDGPNGEVTPISLTSPD